MIDNTERQRFELIENGLLAFADYRRSPTGYIINHVEAAPALRGTGAAARLMEGIVAHARANDMKLTPRCSYATIWLKRHPETADLIG